MIDVVPKPKTLGKQLFLSRHVVTESSEFDGGVLVNEDGIIEAVLKRDIINSLLSQNLNDLKVFLFYLAFACRFARVEFGFSQRFFAHISSLFCPLRYLFSQ